MTATLVYARRNSSQNSSSSGAQPRAQSSSNSAHRHIKVSSRLAPQIYLGHISRRAASAAVAASPPVPVVVKCAGQLQRELSSGRLMGPWKEWQAARQLRAAPRAHPNVVQVFDTFVQRSRVFVVMEHCARGDLLAELVRTQPQSRLDEQHALRIARQLASGLRFLHEVCRLAHRDVSLENVFVAADGACKLGDFGLSTRADAPARDCVGKTQYVAPEVVARPSYDPVAADVWSLGILLFMLLTGAPLLELASPASPDFEHVKARGCLGVLQDWRMASQLSPETLDLLDKMLQFDPARRLQTMADVLRHPALRQEDGKAAGDAAEQR
jgi:serine/threonine protein kinase